MILRLSIFLQWAYTRAKNRWVRLGLGLVVMFASTIYLWGISGDLFNNLSVFQINWVTYASAVLVTCLTMLTGATTWWFLLLSFSVKANWLQSAGAHLGPNLAKYLPGYGWQLLGKAYFTSKLDVPMYHIGALLTIETSIYLLMGWGLAFLLAPKNLLSRHQLDLFVNISFNSLSHLPFVGVILIGFTIVFPYFVGYIFGKTLRHIFRWRFYLTAIIFLVATWLLSGLGFWLLAQALSSLPLESFVIFFFVMAVALNIGFMVLIAPSGLGVREAIIVFFLSSFMSGAQALALALLSRVTVVICEFLMAFLVISVSNLSFGTRSSIKRD